MTKAFSVSPLFEATTIGG